MFSIDRLQNIINRTSSNICGQTVDFVIGSLTGEWLPDMYENKSKEEVLNLVQENLVMLDICLRFNCECDKEDLIGHIMVISKTDREPMILDSYIEQRRAEIRIRRYLLL
jgi:hypothetical protein